MGIWLFPLFAVNNIDLTCMREHVFSVLLGICLGVELLDHVVLSWLTWQTLSTQEAPFDGPSSNDEASRFSAPWLTVVVVVLFSGYSRPTWVRSESHCRFNLQFLNYQRCWTSFCAHVDHLYVSFGEMSIWIFCPHFNWVTCLFYCGAFWMSDLRHIHDLQTFSPFF